MYPHHERALEKVKAHFEQDPTILALLFGGSLAKGWGSETSDVDIMLIVSEEEFARRDRSGELLYFSLDFTDYEGGYIDGKYQSVAFLEEIAECGSEVARAAFYGVQIVFSRLPDLDATDRAHSGLSRSRARRQDQVVLQPNGGCGHVLHEGSR